MDNTHSFLRLASDGPVNHFSLHSYTFQSYITEVFINIDVLRTISLSDIWVCETHQLFYFPQLKKYEEDMQII